MTKVTVVVIIIVIILFVTYCHMMRPHAINTETDILNRLKSLELCISLKWPELYSRIKDVEIRFNSNETYTFDKRIIYLCLKSGSTNAIFHTLLHELAHICNTTWGHDEDFINMFDFWLSTAIDCGVYKQMTKDEIVCNVHTHK